MRHPRGDQGSQQLRTGSSCLNETGFSGYSSASRAASAARPIFLAGCCSPSSRHSCSTALLWFRKTARKARCGRWPSGSRCWCRCGRTSRWASSGCTISTGQAFIAGAFPAGRLDHRLRRTLPDSRHSGAQPLRAARQRSRLGGLSHERSQPDVHALPDARAAPDHQDRRDVGAARGGALSGTRAAQRGHGARLAGARPCRRRESSGQADLVAARGDRRGLPGRRLDFPLRRHDPAARPLLRRRRRP